MGYSLSWIDNLWPINFGYKLNKGCVEAKSFHTTAPKPPSSAVNHSSCELLLQTIVTTDYGVEIRYFTQQFKLSSLFCVCKCPCVANQTIREQATQ